MKKRILFLVIASILLITACNKQNQVTQVNQEEKLAIKIGAIFPFTGEYSSYGEGVKKGIDLAVEKVNQEKNLHFEVIYEDSSLDAQKAVSAVNKLTSLNEVKYVLSFSSRETLAICPITNNNNLILLTSCSSPEVSTECGEFTFRNYPSDIYQGKELADKVFNKNYKKVALLYVNDAYGLGLKNEFIKERLFLMKFTRLNQPILEHH